ncbi:hypothetical protein K432DRAFT_387661 [Lepidopterella palustris CBS 459.81]|uniref:Uncharacterized protein n=1 Tax=Lepidopterella palustris CBS 459.81 TaxID=1314670 RepID=A0A8E2DWK2_9PEZI|nr:hypothetical protein K432DRAFT_387661 [Lepidopterella palustris CBS 459.81]
MYKLQIIFLCWPSFAVGAATVTQPPERGSGFIGYTTIGGSWSPSSCSSGGYYTTYAVDQGIGPYARCCAPNASCPAVTGCIGSVLLETLGETRLTCSTEGTCYSGFIYEHIGDPNPLTNIGCGGGTFTLYRTTTSPTTPPLTNSTSSITSGAHSPSPSATGSEPSPTSHSRSTLDTGGIIGIAIGVPAFVVSVVGIIVPIILGRRQRLRNGIPPDINHNIIIGDLRRGWTIYCHAGWNIIGCFNCVYINGQ